MTSTAASIGAFADELRSCTTAFRDDDPEQGRYVSHPEDLSRARNESILPLLEELNAMSEERVVARTLRRELRQVLQSPIRADDPREVLGVYYRIVERRGIYENPPEDENVGYVVDDVLLVAGDDYADRDRFTAEAFRSIERCIKTAERLDTDLSPTVAEAKAAVRSQAARLLDALETAVRGREPRDRQDRWRLDDRATLIRLNDDLAALKDAIEALSQTASGDDVEAETVLRHGWLVVAERRCVLEGGGLRLKNSWHPRDVDALRSIVRCELACASETGCDQQLGSVNDGPTRPPVKCADLSVIVADEHAVFSGPDGLKVTLKSSDFCPNDWFKVQALAHQGGALEGPQPSRSGRAQSMDPDDFDAKDQADLRRRFASLTRRQRAFDQSVKRIRKVLTTRLNLADAPIPKETNGPYRSAFKSIRFDGPQPPQID